MKVSRRRLALVVAFLLATSVMFGCSPKAPMPGATPGATPTPTPTSAPMVPLGPSPTLGATPTPSPVPSLAPTAMPTTPAPTPTPTVSKAGLVATVPEYLRVNLSEIGALVGQVYPGRVPSTLQIFLLLTPEDESFVVVGLDTTIDRYITAAEVTGKEVQPPQGVLPLELDYDENMPLTRVGSLLPYHSNVKPDEVVNASKVMGDYEKANVWEIAPAADKVHPAVFPKELAARVIQFYSFKGDLVFDPFAGVGTVGQAALLLERYFFLVEQEKKYVERAASHLSSLLLRDQPPRIYSLEQFGHSLQEQGEVP